MKGLPCLPRLHHQQDNTNSSLLHAPLRASTHPCWQWDGGKRVSLHCSFCWWSCKLCFPYHRVGPRHPDTFCNIRVKYFSRKTNAKMLSCNNQSGSRPPLPLLFSRMFLPMPYTSVCLAGSFSLPISKHVYNFHDCSLSEFLMQAPSEWLRCPGHAPTLCEQWGPCPLPDSIPPAPSATSSYTSSPSHSFIQLYHISFQPSPALSVSRGRSWHIHHAWHSLSISNAWGRTHLLHCFCNKFSPIYRFICMVPSHREGRLEEGKGVSKDSPGVDEYGRERKQIQVAPSQPHKTHPLQVLIPLHPITQTHCPWMLEGWAAFNSSNRQVGQPSLHPLHHPVQQQ